MALMNSVMTVVVVSIAIVVAVAVLSQLYPTVNQFSCPSGGTGETDLQAKLRTACSTFTSMGGILLVVVPIIAIALVILLYFRGGF